ncbi:hypothetical protein [Synechococcus sp. BA-132 BA5]|uniref:hypothetical protein n=1 Tax=Synechococcus sp. BA-132 BA5 TaxID=3110252 RepID=UPI002B210D1F|nr:hypothetical protein [Synechococcus sp. BA-132 BA5]MEA5414045.1 hypothetical protein [Synechococcus sp. BA-132 BA5]
MSTGSPVSPTPTVRFVNGVKYAATSLVALVGDDYRTPVVPNVMCLAGGDSVDRLHANATTTANPCS